VHVDPGSAATHAIENKGCNGETGDRVTVEILGLRIVEKVEIKLKERRHRPDDNGGEKRGITLRDVSMSILHVLLRDPAFLPYKTIVVVAIRATQRTQVYFLIGALR